MKSNNAGFSRRQHIRTISAIVFSAACYQWYQPVHSPRRSEVKLFSSTFSTKISYHINGIMVLAFFPVHFVQGSSVEDYLNDGLLWCMLIRVGMVHVFSNESSDVLGLVSMSSWRGSLIVWLSLFADEVFLKSRRRSFYVVRSSLRPNYLMIG